MARMIDADALRKQFDDIPPFVGLAGSLVHQYIDEAPTVDAVEVVRCRECKHCDPETHHCDHHMGTVAPLRRKPEDFCSYGERKDGDGNG